MPDWIIEALLDGNHPDHSEACIVVAEISAEMDYEEPGSSDTFYDWMFQEYGIEM
jgi:hypothetical protein